MHDTPVSLLEQLRYPSDDRAWGRFVELYTPFMVRCIGPLGLQESDRADLLQDVFVTLYRKLPEFTYDGAKSFRGWLRTILLNHWRDALRKRGRQPGNGAALDQHPASDGVAEFDEREYRHYLVNRALQLMRADFQPTTWQACWENVVNDRPATAVAAQLGISVDAVYAATYRVLRRLRQELDGLLE
jgi:RNA polymerase sigma-70 factor (ECF subfamily)